VYGNAKVSGNAWVSGNAQVSGNAWVSGNAQVYGDAWVSGNAWVSGDARVYGNARVYGDARVYGNARVYGDARVYGNASLFWASKVGTENGTLTVFNSKDGTLTVTRGCFIGSCDAFLAKSKRVHDEKTHREYSLLIEVAKSRIVCKAEESKETA
jgi:carbonic anhydrase/acetyltransferase-like protein (isoleucine patch superfamily)